ncbi:MAG: hypothetical protein JW759_07260, partial [Candidatus Coatesbacteria bacterium]|nr:hypothetical protein [Candidatus Coatesbacteria bacterium]
ETRVADLKQQIAEAAREPDEDEELEDDAERLTEDEITALRSDLRAARRDLAKLQGELLDRLEAKRAELTEPQAQVLVLDIQRERLTAELDRHVTARRQVLVTSLETLWDKYCFSLREIEAERDAAKARLEGFMIELRYV